MTHDSYPRGMHTKGSTLISIVIPTRNEPQIQDVISGIHEVMKDQTYEIIVIDKSDDDTAFRAAKAGALVEKQLGVGLGNALIQGLRRSHGEIIVTMDGDLSHDPKYLPELVEKCGAGRRLVIGSRRATGGGIVGWNIWRKAISAVGNAVGRFVAGIKVDDVTSGYRAYSRRAIEEVQLAALKSTGYAFQLEILWLLQRANSSIGVVPIVFHDRRAGASKLSRGDMLDFLLTAFRIRLQKTWASLLRTA